jgi:hypothetical protein
MASDETKDLENQDADVEGHKLSREVWAREGSDNDDNEDTEGHKVSREVYAREGADDDDTEGHKLSRE